MLEYPSGEIICMADVISGCGFTSKYIYEECHFAEDGSRGGIRTPDRVVNSHLLCRLSYPGISTNSLLLILPHSVVNPENLRDSAG